MPVVAKITITDDALLAQPEYKTAASTLALANPASTVMAGSASTPKASENALVDTDFSDPLLNSKTLPYMQKYNSLEQEMERLRRKQEELMLRAANCKDSEESNKIQKQLEELGVQIQECKNELDVLIIEMQSAMYTVSNPTDTFSAVGDFINTGGGNVAGGQIAGSGFSKLTGTGSAIVNVAGRYLGYNEKDGSYHLFTNGGDYAWCAAFVSYVVKQAYKEMGKSVPSGFGSASVSTLMNWGIKNNLFLNTANLPNSQKGAAIANNVKPGDVIIFKGNGMSHTGVVKSVNADGSFTTIEGNTSDQVKVRSYDPTKNTITGFIRMA